MYILKNESRRAFLRQASAFSAMVGSGAAPLAMNLAAMGNAAAQQSNSGYKAIVCLFMNGGNDSFNMVLPTDTASWNAYTTTRNLAPDSIALLPSGTLANGSAALGSPARLGGVLPLTLAANAPNTPCALHPVMTGVQKLFNQQRLAVLANIGPLLKPATRSTFYDKKIEKPKFLFSHNDQQNMWQSMQAEGAKSGWGGRLIEQFFATPGSVPRFSAISLGGNAVWLSGSPGSAVKPLSVGTAGPRTLGARAGEQTFASPVLTAALHKVAQLDGMPNTNLFEKDLAAVNRRTIELESELRNALLGPDQAPFGTPPVATTPPDAPAVYSQANDPLLKYLSPRTAPSSPTLNPLAQQFQMVARMIEAGKRNTTLIGSRQVFFVSIGGFDTHSTQNLNHADLMARVDHALSYFNATLESLGLSSNVTTFTASDFGRTFTSNGDGTDHGWGAHHFVMGGAVNGGRIFGQWPVLVDRTGFGASERQLDNGSLVPTMAVDHLGAALAKWFGVGDDGVSALFPNLKNWGVNAPGLNFYRA